MIVNTVSVFCDVSGPTCVGWVAQTTSGTAAARKEAREDGWKRENGRDVCPACQSNE